MSFVIVSFKNPVTCQFGAAFLDPELGGGLYTSGLEHSRLNITSIIWAD